VSLHKLFNPRSIAIVGVSTKKATFQVGGRAVYDHLRLHGYPHRIDLVTREAVMVDGVASVTDLASLGHVPDCLLVSVPADDVYGTIERALDLGCRAFVVITGGFSEAGAEGAARQAKLEALVSGRGAAMLGPNTTGFVNFADHVAMSSTSRISSTLAPTGDVGLIVQSGALGSALLEEAARGGIGLSHLISTGNEAVSGLADFVERLADDPHTKAIALYVEGFRQPDRMLEAARKAHEAGKPIVIYKTGRSDAGRRMAAGHTGALVGSRGVYEAAVRQFGWIDVRSIEDLLPVAHYVARSGAASTMGIITVSGGFGGCVADALEETGAVKLPTPGAATVERMRGDVPAFLSANNPIDIGGTPFRRQGGFADCLDALADDPALEAIAVANTPIVPPWARDVAEAVKATRARTGKPISAVWPSEIFNAEALEMLRGAGVPTFTRVDTFTAAVAGAAAAADARAKPSHLIREGRSGGTPRIEGDVEALDESASKDLLKAAGISFPKETFVPAGDMVALDAAATTIGYPVTLKGIAQGVIHKSELGLVAVALPDADALSSRAQGMADSAARHGLSFEGFLVAETVRPRVEVIVGLGLDPEFGPTLTFGAGGIFTEIMQDVAIRILPLDEDEIRTMIESCRIAKILHGARGGPRLDIDALVARVMDIAALAPRLAPDFAGLEFNPIGVGLAGEGSWPLDATVFKVKADS
jgi:acyl-CoA synthetase (NDP forming)